MYLSALLSQIKAWLCKIASPHSLRHALTVILFASSFFMIGMAYIPMPTIETPLQKALDLKQRVSVGLAHYLWSQAEPAPKPLAVVIPTPALHKDHFVERALDHYPPSPVWTEKERLSLMAREDILKDPLDRISTEFKIPQKMDERVAFWFDIYTKYGGNHHVIHHVRYPWIIYKVIDTSSFLHGSGPLWLRRQRAENHVKAEREKVQRALGQLARRSHFRGLPPLERQLYHKLSSLKGSRQAVHRLAAQSVRSQLGQRDFYVSALRRSSRYLPYMEEEFLRQGLPVELTRLPFVESSFNEKAQSKVGASGIWQIMPRTGQAYITVNNFIDERNSPLKATALAGRLLKQYQRSLKSWPLAVTAYNHGIGNIRKSMRAAGSEDLPTIIERYHQGHFRFASSNFYACFLAALYAEKYHDVIFENTVRDKLLARETILLSQRMSIKDLARLTNLDVESLLEYNLDIRDAIRHNRHLPKGFELHLPPGHREKLIEVIGEHGQPKERQASVNKTAPKSI